MHDIHKKMTIENNQNIQTNDFLNRQSCKRIVAIVEAGKNEEKFDKAVLDCKGVTVDDFFDELENRLKKYYEKTKSDYFRDNLE